jgi:uncharacterized protein YkwD
MRWGMNAPRILLILVAAFAALALPATASAGVPAKNLVKYVNNVRDAHGLKKVKLSSGLSEAARRHSRDMVRRQYFAHTSPTGVTLYDRVVRSSFTTRGRWYAGETLAWGSGPRGKAKNIVKAWMNSPSHRAVILSRNPRYGWIGVSRVRGKFLGNRDARVWTADFGQR